MTTRPTDDEATIAPPGRRTDEFFGDRHDPFPDAELEALAQWHESAAKKFPGKFAAEHKAAAKTCRDAIKCQADLNERFLLQETELRLALAKLAPEGDE